ncbi:hypothetical protein [Erythrobacter phage vB_EliS-L02]|nr:hypothetical protein [Erythrobacter phage vB_EliS-L02]
MNRLHNILGADRAIMKAFERLPYRPVPEWLGDFSFVTYDRPRKLPAALFALFEHMRDIDDVLFGGQKWNRVFVQRYREGESVSEHRDPKTNVDHTLIAIFGDFDGATSRVDDEVFQLRAGDMLRLPCTINGRQGPLHSVSPVTRGTRYALILNHIDHGSLM